MARLLAQGMRLIFLSQLVVERGKACRVRLIKVIFMTEIKCNRLAPLGIFPVFAT